MTRHAQARRPSVGWSVLCLVVHLQVVLNEVGLADNPMKINNCVLKWFRSHIHLVYPSTKYQIPSVAWAALQTWQEKGLYQTQPACQSSLGYPASMVK